MLQLTPTQRRALRARAHHLRPVVIIGETGLTPALLREIDASLRSHELIKVRVAGEDRTQRHALESEICRALDAGPVQTIGKMLVIYRPRPGEVAAAPLQARGKKRQKRRTKRSHQI